MLMNEIASAGDTLELWKMVNDSVWAALQKLQTEEKKRKAAEQRAAAAKRGPRKHGAVATKKPPAPTAPPPKPPAPPQVQPAVQPSNRTAAVAVPTDNDERLGLQPRQSSVRSV